MQQTYLFYDLETSGLNKSFDQVLQFAAIRTDLNLKEIEREQFYVQLSPSTIPSPYATITHRISLADCESGLTEFEAIKKIHAMMNTPGTISLGYNTLQFDDEFMRFSFYRHLLSPYTHQFANECSRMDLYPVTMMFSLFKPDILKWQTREGKLSLKLDGLIAENNLAEGQAHNAIVDVEATVELARRLSQEKEIWKYLLDYFDKGLDRQRMSQLPVFLQTDHGKHYDGLIAEGRLGARNKYLAPVICLGTHKHYTNQTLWLRLDLPELQQVNSQNLDEKTWVIHKRFGEPGFLLPPVERYVSLIDEERNAIVAENKSFLKSNPELFGVICAYHQDYKYPEHDRVDVCSGLYLNGFLSRDEQALNDQFVKSANKFQVLQRFQNPHLRELGVRLLGKHFPDQLDETMAHEYQDYLQSVFSDDQQNSVVDFKGEPRKTIASALKEAQEVRQEKELDDQQLQLLNELEEYLRSLSTDAVVLT